VYVDLQRHGERQQEWRNQAMLRMARSLKLQIVATNGVRYANSFDREILDIFTAIRHHTQLDHAGRLLAFNDQRFIRPAKEMRALCRDVPEAIANTVHLSSRLDFELDNLGYEVPYYRVPDDDTMDSFLRKRVSSAALRICKCSLKMTIYHW
jgi:error-prone DNA polymerase